MPVMASEIRVASAVPPPLDSASTASRRRLRLPTARTDWISPSESRDKPAESYPRYSSRSRPCMRSSPQERSPTYPTIPHIQIRAPLWSSEGRSPSKNRKSRIPRLPTHDRQEMSVSLKVRSVLLFFGFWPPVPVATNRSMGGNSHSPPESGPPLFQ